MAQAHQAHVAQVPNHRCLACYILPPMPPMDLPFFAQDGHEAKHEATLGSKNESMNNSVPVA